MRQILISENTKEKVIFQGASKQYHYLCHVLRFKQGDRLKGIDKSGYIYLLEVIKSGSQSIELRVLKKESKKASTTEIVLLQCLPKGRKMNIIVRMATEAGVSSIVPVISKYTIPKIKTHTETTQRLLRWQKISREALQQSNTPVLPIIKKPITLNDLLTSWNGTGKNIFCHQDNWGEKTLHSILKDPYIKRLNILIGPEGGLAKSEVDLLLKKNFFPVCLCDNILRTETAAIFALAACKIILLERKAWRIN